MPHIKQTTKEVRYLNKDFDGFRKSLIDFAKVYFPNTFSDFNESDPGMMFIEMASYVGDVLSFYMDKQMNETLLLHAEETANVYSIVQALGYKPKVVSSSTTKLDVFQLVPAIGTGASARPDYRYALTIKDTFEAKSETTGTPFQIDKVIDFSFSSSVDPTEVVVYQQNEITGDPELFLLKKTVEARSGEIKTTAITFDDPEKFKRVALPANNIIEIIDVTDSDGNVWYEVPFLAQDTIFDEVENTAISDPLLAQYRKESPFLLKVKKTSRRFVTRVREDNTLEIQFGSGISNSPDEEIIPNPFNVNIQGSQDTMSSAFDPANFIVTRTYGQVPNNTTLTFRYLVGKGEIDNVPSNNITQISVVEFGPTDTGLDAALVALARNSIAVINPISAVGARGPETIDEIKINALSTYNSQNRAVTREDYIVRTYSMPTKFGSVAKAYIVQDDQLSSESIERELERVPNPFALNLYVLGVNDTGQLTQLNPAVKQNLKTYLDQYRLLTDAVNIKDAHIINIGVNFEIIALPNFNKKEVIVRCIDKLREYFKVSRWQINQPIVLGDIILEVAQVHGVQSVLNLEITNNFKVSDGYSGNLYDIKSATVDGILYPALDPSIFEVKFPNRDIKGRVISI